MGLALDQVVLRAREDGLHRERLVARPLSTTIGASGATVRSVLEGLEPLGVRQAQVEQDTVDGAASRYSAAVDSRSAFCSAKPSGEA